MASRTGDGISAAAMPLVAIQFTNASNIQIGLLTAASYAAIFTIGLPAGMVVRRFALKPLQVGMDVFRGLVILSIPVAAWFDVLTFSHLLAVAFIVGLASNIFDVASATFLPQVVPRADLMRRNSLLSGTSSTTALVGPSLGGLLVQTVGTLWCVVGDAVSYLVSGAILSSVVAVKSPQKADAGRSSSWRSELFAGIAFVMRHPTMRAATFAATAVNFGAGALMACMAPFLVRQLALPPGTVGLVLAAEGVGAIAATVILVRMVRRIGNARTFLWAAAACPLGALLMPAAKGSFAAAVVIVGAAGLAGGVAAISVIARTHRQMATPPELLSRVMASVRFVSQGVVPLGALVGGAISELVSPRAGLVVVVVASACAPIALWLSPVRSARELDTQPAQDQPTSSTVAPVSSQS
ncbi:MAG TPA: MFS transporter [Candidatus Limnocylindrales bacterium]|nr:MFS transporter [Candidatus Limnocylindrales bacterium]